MENTFSFLVASLNYFGDILMTLPLATSLKAAYPESRVTFCIGSRGKGVEGIVRGVDRWIERGSRDSFFSRKRILREMKEVRPDKIILLQQSKYLLSLARAVNPEGIVNPPHHEGKGLPRHVTDRALIYAEALGAYPVQEINFREDPEASAEEIPALFFPGTTRPSKMWPVEKWLALGEMAWKEKGIVPVFAGSPADKPISVELKKAAFPYRDLIGRTTIAELTGLIRRSRVVVSVDNGAMHLSDFLHRPTIALFGSTDPTQVGPVQKESVAVGPRGECILCRKHKCTHPKIYCMDQISPDEVWELFREAWEKGY
ncbi:MAG TPA: glycosyltransferase family 9 protein [Candidatus Mcinerneyibacteriales bacterium]|nr:glycosyltransferase family 9 protein [Candidatus Mcinerneyibacteriales bacterium]